jgi:hypothetical protein
MRDFAKRLIACETKGHRSSETNSLGTFPVPEKLRLHLATLMGTGGFRALLARALVVASAEVPSLRGLHVRADGSLGGTEELQGQIDPDEISEGRVVLLALLLGLLVDFIGKSLTVRLVGDVWPKVSFNHLVSDGGGKYEKTR